MKIWLNQLNMQTKFCYQYLWLWRPHTVVSFLTFHLRFLLSSILCNFWCFWKIVQYRITYCTLPTVRLIYSDHRLDGCKLDISNLIRIISVLITLSFIPFRCGETAVNLVSISSTFNVRFFSPIFWHQKITKPKCN